MNNKLKELRNKKGLTTLELSEKSKVARTTLSRIENDKRRMNINHAKALAEYFNVSIDYIMGYSFKERLSNFLADCERDYYTDVTYQGPFGLDVIKEHVSDEIDDKSLFILEIIKKVASIDDLEIIKEALDKISYLSAKDDFK